MYLTSVAPQGFSRPSHSSYRGVKPARVSAVSWRIYLRREAALPQVPVTSDHGRRGCRTITNSRRWLSLRGDGREQEPLRDLC